MSLFNWPDNHKTRKISLAVVIVLGIVFFGYTALRAWRVALTIDEANTLNNYVNAGFLSLFRVDTANNHILNSLLTWLVTRIVGTSELALRLPNLLGYLLYLIFSFRLFRQYTNNLTVISGFVILNANPYVLEFFSLCRGYGLALGLLLAALFYFFRFMDEAREARPVGSRQLSLALFAAGAAVLADLTLIFIFLGIVVLALVIIAKNTRAARGKTDSIEPPSRARWHPVLLTGLGILVVLINGSNLFRDAWLSERLFADVAVSVFGLTDEECLSLAVFKKNISGELEKVPFQTNGWRFDRPHYYAGIQVEIPAVLWPKATALKIQIDRRPFVFSGPALRALASSVPQDPIILLIPDDVSLKRSRFSPMKSSINWKGDGPYFVRLGKRTLIVILLFGLLWLAFSGVGLFGEKLHLVTRRVFRPLAAGVLTLALLVAVPIFFLEKSGQLYWGGNVGFFHDTVLGLIQDVFYGKSYVRGQEYILLGFMAGVSLLFLFLAMIYAPVRRSVSSGPAFALLALISLTWGFYMGERPFFGLPYLLGRTAVFFVPLACLALILILTSIQAHPRLAPAVAAVLCATALAAAMHFAFSANTSFASEWMLDADNKALISDIQTLRERVGSPDKTVRLGVPSVESLPVLDYYVKRKGLRWLKLRGLPAGQRCDAYYLNEAFDPSRMVLLKRYPRSGHILVAQK
jgi:hypothetical protein